MERNRVVEVDPACVFSDAVTGAKSEFLGLFMIRRALAGPLLFDDASHYVCDACPGPAEDGLSLSSGQFGSFYVVALGLGLGPRPRAVCFQECGYGGFWRTWCA